MERRGYGAVILAAGLSSRMQAFKPLLRIGGKTLLERVIELFQSAGVDEVLTVVGHRATELLPVIEATSSGCVVNENYRHGMFSSIQAGVERLGPDCKAFYVLPVDIPLVQGATVRDLAEAFRQNPEAAVCYPQYADKKGHPPLVSGRLIGHILAWPGQGGLRGLLNEYAEEAVNVPVDDPFIHMDVDTAEDLLRLKEHFEKDARNGAEQP